MELPRIGKPTGRVSSILLRWALALLILLPSVGCSRPAASEDGGEQADSSWRSLFDGTSLEGWEATRFGGEGRVALREGVIVLDFGEPLTGITWTGDVLRTNYELTLEAMRAAGNDFFCGLTFPVGEEHCSLILGGWGGGLAGLSSIDGHDASENETSRFMSFERGRWYRVRMRVTDDRIQVWLNGDELADVARKDHTFSVRSEVRLSKPLGIAAWRTRAQLRDIRVRSLDEVSR